MKRVVLCFSFLVFSLSILHSQSNTRGISADTAIGRAVTSGNNSATVNHKILLIPFFSNMCMSEIDKDVNKATQLDFKHITEAFRVGFDLAMYRTLHESNTTVSLLQGRYKSDSVLSYIYGSTGYSYALVPGTIPDLVAKNDSGKKKHYIKNGQLQVPIDYSSRFMDVSIKNPKLLPSLYKKYNTDIFVFINELDIKNVVNPTDNLSEDTYRREATVQYSILDKDGKSVAKGIAKTYFPFRENNPTEISEKYFTVLAHTILKDYAQGLTINQLSDEQRKKAIH